MTETQQPLRAENLDTAPSLPRRKEEIPSTQTAEDQGLSNQPILVTEEHSSKANFEAEGNGQAEDLKKDSPQTHRFDPNFTQNLINATGPKASPRLRKVMGSLIQHIHDFARENEVTVDEWMAGLEMVHNTHPN